MSLADLADLGAAEAARRSARAPLDPVALVEACLARIDRADALSRRGCTSTATARCRPRAQRAAEAAAGAFPGRSTACRSRSRTSSTSRGCPRARARRRSPTAGPTTDAAAVARLRAAGAVILGKVTTTTFALMDPSPTGNPWNVAHTPGGSSSGSAAAVAARMAALALGSQTVGSVLRPAAFCGVVGFKPTHGRISAVGVVPLSWSNDHVGIFGRAVEDAALALQILAGPDRADPYSQRARG